MFRLKQLDDTPENITNGTDRPIDPHSLTPAMPYLHSRPSAYIQAQSTRFTHLVASACVFHVPSEPTANDSEHRRQKPRLLLVQRAAHDTYPLHQEIPGGMVDATDATICDAVARELGEETDMVMKKVLAQVEPAETFTTGWGRRMKKWVRLVWIVEADGAATAATEEVVSEGGDGEGGKGVTDGPVTVSASAFDGGDGAVDAKYAEHGPLVSGVVETDDYDEEVKAERALELAKAQAEAKWLKERKTFEATLGVPKVKLDPNEHVSYFWATEEEVRERRARSGGENVEAAKDVEEGEGEDWKYCGQWRELLFIRDEQVDTLLRAFALYKEKMGYEMK